MIKELREVKKVMEEMVMRGMLRLMERRWTDGRKDREEKIRRTVWERQGEREKEEKKKKRKKEKKRIRRIRG